MILLCWYSGIVINIENGLAQQVGLAHGKDQQQEQ